MIADMINNKRTKSISDWTVYQRQKIKHFNCLYHTVILLKVPKDVRLNAAHFSIMKSPDKRELQQLH